MIIITKDIQQKNYKLYFRYTNNKNCSKKNKFSLFNFIIILITIIKKIFSFIKKW